MTTLSPRWFETNLLKWFDKHGRKDLPWKKPLSPYRVWLSEVMLQQTQVATVLAYFEKFIAKFPEISKLAKAPLEEVLALWAGLGYYARARNLHKTAQIIHSQFKNQFPKSLEALMDLPGIGRSTAGAILAQSFNMSVPILDGNVKRVLCRVHCIEGYPEDRKVQEQLWELSNKYTSKKRAADYTQAIMDLGATCCLRSKPLCQSCPLQTKCQAYLKNLTDAFPEKKLTKKIPTRHLYMLCLLNKEGNILLEERPPKGIWGGLFSLPEFEEKEGLYAFLKENFALKKASLQALSPIKHTFTHFHLEISPFFTVIHNKKATLNNKRWQPLKDLSKIGLPAPIQKILRSHFFKDYA